MHAKKIVILLLMPMLMMGATLARTEDLVDTAITSGSFKTFLAAVKAAGMTEQLRSGGPLTIFAPTDAAFSQLPKGEWEQISRDKAKLASLLSYHMISGSIKIVEVKPGMARSVEGATLQLKSDNGMVSINGARVTESDLIADNGIIHAIDKVLILPD